MGLLWKPFRESEQNSQRAGIGRGFAGIPLQAEFAEGCIDIPDQCIVFFYRAMPGKFLLVELIRYSSPTRCQDICWGNIICTDCVDNGIMDPFLLMSSVVMLFS